MEERNVVGQRIASLRKGVRMSQGDLADKIDYSREQMGRFERGENIPNDSILEKISALFGTHIAYIKGETDIKDFAKYCQSIEAAEDEAAAKQFERLEAQEQGRKRFFSLCGYSYENLDGTAEYEFAGIGDIPPLLGPYRLTPYVGGDGPAYFGEADLDALIRKIKDLVEFECYRQRRAGGKSNAEKK